MTEMETKQNQTKEEIVDMFERESCDRILDRFEHNERVIYPSMQLYADQQSTSLQSEIEKCRSQNAELNHEIDHLKSENEELKAKWEYERERRIAGEEMHVASWTSEAEGMTAKRNDEIWNNWQSLLLLESNVYNTDKTE